MNVHIYDNIKRGSSRAFHLFFTQFHPSRNFIQSLFGF